MKKFSYSAIILSFISINVLAGDSKGYGGDIIKCSEANVYHNTPLDYYELKEKFGWEVPSDILIQDDELLIVFKVLNSFKQIDIHRYLDMQKNLETFYNDVKWVLNPLANVDDAGEYILPTNCKLIQIINQNQKILSGHKKYLIRKDLWSQINAVSKAILILHELLYLDSEGENSESIRELVARAFTDKVNHFSDFEYFHFLRSAKFKTFTKAGIQLYINEKINYYATGQIRSGSPVEESTLSFKDNTLHLSHDIVEFYKDGSLKSFCSRSGLNLNIFSHILPSSCASFFGHYHPTKVYKNGQIKESTLFNENIKFKNQTYIFGDINSSGHYFSIIQYNEDQSLKLFQHVQLLFEVNVQDTIYFSAYSPIFFKDSVLIKATIDKRQSLETSGNKILITGDTTFSNNHLKTSYLAVQTSLKINKNSMTAKKNTKVSFHKDMSIESLILSSSQTLVKKDGSFKIYKEGSKIIFDTNGDIL